MPARPGRHLDRRLRCPCGVGVQPQRVVGEGRVQRLDGRHLLLGREHPALEFDCGEAVFVDDAAGLRDDAVGVERLAERVGLAAGVAGPLVEQVGAERHGVAHLAAEQIGHRPAGGVALHVEARDLER